MPDKKCPPIFTSYAQNFEDVILWRALGHVSNGSYVDIGANDPENSSVSLAFYKRGWRGVHAEPIAEFAQRLRDSRSDEIVIEAAIGAHVGDLTIYHVGNGGMSTAIRHFADEHASAGHIVKPVTIPCVTLSTVLANFEGRDVHWMKIDVEGMEADVIASWQPSVVRPWIVVIESTLPNSPTQKFEDWEPTLLQLGYEFVYFDGLNRFYVSHAHPELKSFFGPGPNFFDNFSITTTSPFSHLLAASIQAADAERAAAVTSKTLLTDELSVSRSNEAELSN